MREPSYRSRTRTRTASVASRVRRATARTRVDPELGHGHGLELERGPEHERGLEPEPEPAPAPGLEPGLEPVPVPDRTRSTSRAIRESFDRAPWSCDGPSHLSRPEGVTKTSRRASPWCCGMLGDVKGTFRGAALLSTRRGRRPLTSPARAARGGYEARPAVGLGVVALVRLVTGGRDASYL